jgi:tetratricopeptide (TPR) repeat protein
VATSTLIGVWIDIVRVPIYLYRAGPRLAELWGLIGLLSLGCIAVALVFRGKARRHREYSLSEEALLGGAFLAAMLSFRGLHGWVPFLFALGLSAIAAYLLVQGLRLVRRSDLALQRITLKQGGRWTAAGVVTGALLALGAVGWARAALEQRVIAQDARARAAEQHAEEERFRRLAERYNEGVQAVQEGRLEDAIAAFREVVEADPDAQEARENLAGMLCASGRLREGIAEYERALERKPDDAETHVLVARAYLELREPQAALRHLREAVRLAPDDRGLRLFLADLLDATGDAAGARAERERAGEK